jgi:uroporphyrinogen-III decarboxylase
MKSVERVRTAMRGGKPDCVPFIPQICHPHAIRTLGLDFEHTLLDVIRNPQRMNRLTFECVKQYGLDGLRAWMPGNPLDVVQVDGVWYGRDPKTGRRLGQVDFQGGGDVLPLEEPTIHTQEDVDAIPVPSADEVIKSGRLDGIKAILAEAGDDYFVISCPGAFTPEYLTTIRGKEQALIDLMERPDFCRYAQEKALKISIQNALALAKIGIHGLMVADVFGGVIGPAGFREFFLPYFKRFVDELRRRLKERCPVIYMHICGNSTKLFELMADTGVDCIEPLDPLGGVEVQDAKRRVGQRVALMGGIHNVKLAHGTLAEVQRDVQRCLREGAPGGGYVLACGDMLPTETSKEKVLAALEAAHSYRYGSG